MEMTIDSGNYADAAARTECDYLVTDERLKNLRTIELLRSHMESSFDIGRAQNDLKRFLFYGKDLPNVRLADWLSRGGPAGPGDQAYDRLSNPTVKRLIHVALGLQTEAIELQEQLYSHIFHGTELDEVNVAEELGDSCWYIGLACKVLGTTLTAILRQNIAKLFRRYKTAFTAGAALDRDVIAERAALEGLQSAQDVQAQ